MAATDDDQKGRPRRRGALQALTAAAMALPGLMPTAGRAAGGDEVGVVFGYYREGERNLYGVKSQYTPIESDNLTAWARLALTDNLTALVNYRQDTWSGATPIAIAPREWRGNVPGPDGVTGASPYINSHSQLYLDAKTLKPLRTDGQGNLTGGVDNRLVHTISSASRETRRQVDFLLTRDWEEFSLNLGAGVSSENDFTSKFASIGGRWDFNRKLTSLGLGASYTSNATAATLDHDATPYIYDSCGVQCNYFSTTSSIENLPGGKRILHGDRDEWGAWIGVSQILNAGAQVETNLSVVRADGYLGNPYKVVEVAFIDPDQQAAAPKGTLLATVNSLLEQRPDLRNQWRWDFRYAQYIEATDAGLHLNYRYYWDDWGIRAHTLEGAWVQPLGDGWSITPAVRYYTQNAAGFFTPYLVTAQAQFPAVVDPVRGPVFVNANNPNNGQVFFDDPSLSNPDGINPSTGNPVVDAKGNPVSQEVADTLIPKTQRLDRSKLPVHFSSDHRVSAFGSLSAGVALTKQFARGVTFSLGYEYYKHAGSLKWGSGGEGAYADFSYYLLNAGLRIDMDAAGYSRAAQDPGNGHAHGAHGHAAHAGAGAPAGVMFDHTLGQGELMVGLRYMRSRQSGDMLRGERSVGDPELKRNGCRGEPCLIAPKKMTMNMYMLELMYAPADWLTLMLMPQYVNMYMSMRGLLNDSELASLPPDINALYQHHALHGHASGGIGDTGIYSLLNLWSGPGGQVVGALGLSAPTGDVGVKYRNTHQVQAGFMDYGMQLGSGTWDFKPSITWTGTSGGWSWGAQLNGTVRLEDRNESGFAYGNIFQATAWGGHDLGSGFSASLRAAYTRQGRIKGAFNDTFFRLGPTDYTRNYGGRFWDLGIGLNFTAPPGKYQGNRLGIEWLQPVETDVNGYQLDRDGSLFATWQYVF